MANDQTGKYIPQTGRADKHQSNIVGPGREAETRAEEYSTSDTMNLSDRLLDFEHGNPAALSQNVPPPANNQAVQDWNEMLRRAGNPRVEIKEFKYGVK